ncbi:P60-like protein [Saccharata proteae CBS 121410]|uniref:Ribosome biogenesis protein NOP53 n=1 Tax=Saccharata proteae CBS 121410 TaxID=1314787 RepID=A0A9P4HPE2_9PEZI|nr:P60-like protein [Saccharata proteae CBS 121410]
MADASQAPQQHKQRSRKGKKAWRKNVDVTEVQTGLENLRDEVREGGVVAEKASEELFALDTTGDVAIQKEVRRVHKPLKADEILAQRSAVPAVDSRKRSSSRVTNGIVEPSSKRLKNGTYVPHKELQRLKSIAHGGDSQEKNIVKQDGDFDHDPWAAEPIPQDPRFDFLPQKQPIREPKTLKHAPVSQLASGKPVPAVPKPEGGKSYNPLFDEWQALLEKEGEKEVAAEKQRLKEAQEELERQERAIAAAQEPDTESDDGQESAWESEWEGIQSEAEESAEWLKKKRPERKTPQQRKKVERRKAEARKKKWEAQMKKRDQQQNEIKKLAKSVVEKEKQKAERLAALARVKDGEESSDQEEEVLRRRKFGKMPIPEAPLEVVLPDELQESLRLLKPEGNLIKDRYRNMLLRGKMESRRQVQRKKANREATEKWSYKDWSLAKR